MSQRLTQQEIRTLAVAVVPGLAGRARTRVDRNFGLPTRLYVGTVGLYLAFIGVMITVFMNPELGIPAVIFAGFVLMAFGLAGLWTKMQPHNDTAPLSWSQFAARGIDTLSGRLTAREAAVQVLTLPVLILGWGLAVAVIVAFA
ncbi:hypothetical protein V474_19135 [Novosphingobium barchaimii LL02]|uniref:Uncharacterized protein n=1 Tax=Novosphingobium barchaimii LL02 TaxID=1114963 RepID=A0A0J7XVN4_9SPHN|nr:hypothetical protein [Novosphingobium barchaimii]KMS55158.1 hypothetical protein V474_19135 [Novosphingobium barchaimii LL02]